MKMEYDLAGKIIGLAAMDSEHSVILSKAK